MVEFIGKYSNKTQYVDVDILTISMDFGYNLTYMRIFTVRTLLYINREYTP